MKREFGKMKCPKCGAKAKGYYVLSHLTKGLYCVCETKCGGFFAPYRAGLKLPYNESKAYRQFKNGKGSSSKPKQTDTERLKARLKKYLVAHKAETIIDDELKDMLKFLLQQMPS